jgi:hypothetical protein
VGEWQEDWRQKGEPDFFIAHLDVSKAAERPVVLDLWRDFVLRLSATPVVSIVKSAAVPAQLSVTSAQREWER